MWIVGLKPRITKHQWGVRTVNNLKINYLMMVSRQQRNCFVVHPG